MNKHLMEKQNIHVVNDNSLSNKKRLVQVKPFDIHVLLHLLYYSVLIRSIHVEEKVDHIDLYLVDSFDILLINLSSFYHEFSLLLSSHL